MKKIFMFLAVAGVLASCSSDDKNATGGTVTANIDGVAKTFNVVTVDQDTYTEAGESYTDLNVTASIDGNATELFTFTVSKGDVGADVVYDVNYTNGANGYYGAGAVNFLVQTNNNSEHLKGTFSGTLMSDTGVGSIPVTNGTFDINY